MRINQKQYREFYIGCIRLYGVIDTNNAFNVFKHYYPEALKKDFIKDIKSRLYKYTRDYFIWKTRKRDLYLIADEMFAEEDISNIFSLQQNKPFYIPETFDKFIRHSSLSYWKQINHDLIKPLSKLLSEFKPGKADAMIDMIFFHIRDASISSDSNSFTDIFHTLSLWGYSFDLEEMKKIGEILQNLNNNTRLACNKGYTPNELAGMNGPIDIDKVSLTLGPNIIRMLEDGELDIDEYINSIISSDLPPTSKRSILKELKDIEANIDNAAKC